MASLSHTYNERHLDNLLNGARERFGGSPGRPSSGESYVSTEFSGKEHGSHMPLDTAIHWVWDNPLNILPAFVLLATLIAIIGMMVA
jgi:hypothetical protein